MHQQSIGLPLALSAALFVSGCSGLTAAGSALGGLAGGAVATANQVAAAIDPVIAAACKDYTKGRAAADALVGAGLVPANAVAKVTAIEAFGDAACAQPPAGDVVSTAVWLGQLIGEIDALTHPAAQTA